MASMRQRFAAHKKKNENNSAIDKECCTIRQNCFLKNSFHFTDLHLSFPGLVPMVL